jgi:excisionase family DNA binding protein
VTGRLLTAREVADILDVHPETVLRWTRRGELRGVAVWLPGGKIRYRQDKLNEWLVEREATPRRGVSPPPQDAADWQPTAPGGTLASVTAPEGEED